MEAKPVILIGKGASAAHVADSDDYHVAAVSEAVRLCDRCDWLAVNDTKALYAMEPGDFAKASALVLPRRLHDDPRAKSKTAWTVALGHSQCRPPYPRCELFRLHTDHDAPEELPYFGVCWSTAESLVAFLIYRGYRTFRLNGITREAAYHPLFKPRTKKHASHFKINYRRIVTRIREAGGTVE